MKTDNTSKLLLIVTAIFLVSLMMGCMEEPLTEEPEIDDAMMDSIIETETIEGNDNCPNGGFLLKAGNDNNENGLLDEDEVSTINYLCHGENGQIASELLSKTETEPEGDNCAIGGMIVYLGLDMNSDSELSEDEIQSSFILCHGTVGKDGLSSLTVSKTENPGANCANGGIQLLTGQDLNYNNVLDDNEIESIEYVCNGAPAETDYHEYYFSNGLDNYTGTSDVSIAKLDNEGIDEEELLVGSEINPANGFMYPTNSLIHFEGVESILDDLDEQDFEVVEAVLYVRVETPIIDGGEVNALGVQVIVPNAPLFVESEAKWNMASTDREWFDPGTAAIESSAYDYSDMLILPDPTQMKFKGMVPLLLDRSQINDWVESKDNNNGLVLTLIDQSKEYQLSIASSEHDEISYRPMLYIKVKKIANGARYHYLSKDEYKQNWLLKSTADKMKAYHNIF
ncbi:DUF7151 family protein [Reichenbachiella sp.]